MTTSPNITRVWFDSQGLLLGVLPAECVADCSHAGACDADVASWRARLEFTVPRGQAIAYLREFGAWTPADLAGRTDDELAELVLWSACCEIRESGEWFGLVH
jgi:hypothetical protein